jgi:hypothetical protein
MVGPSSSTVAVSELHVERVQTQGVAQCHRPHVERRAAAAATDERIARLSDAVHYLATHTHQVPAHVIPCLGPH